MSITRLTHWRVILLSSFGGALEFYDFVIFSIYAQYIGAAFFPSADPLVSLMQSFLVFAGGYVARPFGGVVFSHFGDRYGRRRVFIVAILTMSCATVAIGLLPTHAQWGTAAPVLMVVLRLIQGFCLGGELPGAITYVVETAPRRAGFVAGVVFVFVSSGVALAALMSLIIQISLDPEQVAAWGWRLGFLFGGAAGLVSFWLRLSLEETAGFRAARQSNSRLPFVELMRSYPRQVLVGISVLAATAGFNGLLFAMPGLLPRMMGYPPLQVIKAQNIGLLFLSAGMLVTAWLGDRIPRRYLLGAGATLAIVFSMSFFAAAEARSVHLYLLFAAAGLVAALFNGPFSGALADLFPTRIRFSGIAVAFNLSFSLLSGPAALISTWLVKVTGSPLAPAYYMIACASLTLAGSLTLRRYEGHILAEVQGQAPWIPPERAS